SKRSGLRPLSGPRRTSRPVQSRLRDSRTLSQEIVGLLDSSLHSLPFVRSMKYPEGKPDVSLRIHLISNALLDPDPGRILLGLHDLVALDLGQGLGFCDRTEIDILEAPFGGRLSHPHERRRQVP